MSLPQTIPPKLSVNGQLVELETRGQLDSMMQFGKSQANLNATVGDKAGVLGSPSRDRLVYISACLIGLHVEVTVRNGSSYSGIFHSTNTEKDFGIILKMARVASDGSHREQKHIPSTATRPQTIIIPSRELVQIIAKDVPLTGEEFNNGYSHEKRQDLMIDSAISLSHFVEERELERWTSDNNDPLCPELEDIFDGSRNRKWDQFETNEVLFGVKSTFNEELYTTKLERGPQTRELEREALRIAREIEGEDTDDLHLAEERGIDFSEDNEIDEETRFSAVYRSGPDDHRENVQLGFQSEGSLGRVFNASAKNEHSDTSERKSCSAGSLQMNETSSQISSETLANDSSSLDRDNQLVSVGVHGHLSTEESRFLGTDVATLEKRNNFDDHKNNVVLNGTLGPTGIGTSSSVPLKSYSHQENLPLDAAVYSSTEESKDLLTESLTPVGHPISAQPTRSSSRPGSSRPSSSDHVGGSPASSGPGLSPCSSMGSIASEKSKLNPHAMEFKLNPNAKSFTPTSSLRPRSPISEGSFYYSANVSAVPHMPGLPVGVAIAPPYGVNQPVVYNPHAVQIQTPPAYVHPGGPYGQQMYFTQPRSVVYMPTYPPEIPYNGRGY